MCVLRMVREGFPGCSAKPPIPHVFLKFIPNRRRLCPAQPRWIDLIIDQLLCLDFNFIISFDQPPITGHFSKHCTFATIHLFCILQGPDCQIDPPLSRGFRCRVPESPSSGSAGVHVRNPTTCIPVCIVVAIRCITYLPPSPPLRLLPLSPPSSRHDHQTMS